MTESWDLGPGDAIERVTLHQRYGGRTQGGIGPSKSSPNVFVFSDPVAGEQHGYFDGWRDDGLFHYTGEGQRGDQQMKSGNGSILHHKEEGRALRVFDGARGTVTYVGEFETDGDQPYYYTDAPETNNGPVRQVIVFRLRPLDTVPALPASPIDRLLKQRVEQVAIEQQMTERAWVAPSNEGHEAERREQKLVLDYRDHLKRKGVAATRLKIVPDGEHKPIFSDVYVTDRNLLVEAKGSVERGAIRMAIGQLADYRRFLDPRPNVAVLVPERPRPDLWALLDAERIDVIWPEGAGFKDSRDGALS